MQSLLLGAVLATLIGGCASVKKVHYPPTANPAIEAAQLEGDIDRAVARQSDIVAPKEMEQAQKRLNRAKEELARNDMKDFWNELGTSRGYLNKANELTATRTPKVAQVMRVRDDAIAAGAKRYSETRRELAALDDSFRRNAKSLDNKKQDNEIWDRAFIDYSALKINSIRESQVGEAQDLIRSAKKKNARYYAPRALDRAETALTNAERAIADNPDDPTTYEKQAEHANKMARNLIAINATARRAAGQSNEQVANEIVTRNRALTDARMTRSELREKESALRRLAAANAGLLSEKEWNEAIEEAREEFSEDEADVYRQGDKLLIRLKKMNFPSGSADVPADSKDLLSKVTSVIEELDAKNVEIQGHTDSTGSPEVNQKLSKERAQAVANILEEKVEDVNVKTVGYGFEKPLTQNKSPQGRATNRRVDVVITPSSPEKED